MPTNTWGMCTRNGTFLLRVHQYVACVPDMPRLLRRKLGQYEGVPPHLGCVGLLHTKSIHYVRVMLCQNTLPNTLAT